MSVQNGWKWVFWELEGKEGSKAHWLDLRSLWKVNLLDCKLGMIKRKIINPLTK